MVEQEYNYYQNYQPGNMQEAEAHLRDVPVAFMLTWREHRAIGSSISWKMLRPDDEEASYSDIFTPQTREESNTPIALLQESSEAFTPAEVANARAKYRHGYFPLGIVGHVYKEPTLHMSLEPMDASGHVLRNPTLARGIYDDEHKSWKFEEIKDLEFSKKISNRVEVTFGPELREEEPAESSWRRDFALEDLKQFFRRRSKATGF